MERIDRKLNQMLTTEQFSYQALRSMYLTLVLDSFFICFISVISTALVSSIGEAAVAAVSMVGTVNGMVSLIFTSLATGGAIVVSRAKGSGDMNAVRLSIGEVTGLCGGIAMVLSALLILFSAPLVGLLYPSVEPLLREYAVRYMRLMAISFIPFSVFNAIFCIFRSLGDTRSSLLLTIVINVAHLLLSLLLINGFHLGVNGSGFSYIIARTLGMGLAVVWLLTHNVYHVRIGDMLHFRPAVTKQIAALGLPLALESMLTQGGMLLVQVYLARLTTTDLAAHAVSNSILNLFAITGSALVSLSSTVCGQCFGAKRPDLTWHYTRNIIRIGRVIQLCTLLVLYPLMPLLLRLYHATEQGTAIVYTALTIAAAAMPFFWCDSNVLPMTLRIVGESGYASAVSVLALALGRCALGYALTIPLGLGVPGLWAALAAEWLLRAAAFRFKARKLTKQLADQNV